ncbi:MAG: asparagine synthase (glutamine-hydrolyzing) [Legionella sp.]
MCGFVGLVNLSHSVPQQTIGEMLSAIAHRGPDDAGIWLDLEADVALGHRRLSIIDRSPAGHQPMKSACGRWVIAFNGEIYNHQLLRKNLELDGWNQGWRGHSDTEVLLAAFSRYGVNQTLAKCVGMFAFAVWDHAERMLIMARDRVGEKPIYYGWLANTFVFGSELAAFYRHPQWRGEINRDALALMMRHNYIPAPYSIFSGIAKLQPGCILRLPYQAKEPIIEHYWSASDIAARGQLHPFNGSPEEAVEQLEQLLRQSLTSQMMADVPLGAFLSGGIDSSTVVALMQSISNQPVRTFTIGFHEEGYNEAIHAQAIAKYLGTCHTELYVSSQEALDVIPRLSTIYSEPFSDSSQIPTFMVSQLAKQSVTVALSGDGGDELFSGYSRYTLSEQLWSKLSRMPALVRAGLANSIQAFSPNTWNVILANILKIAPAKYRFAHPGDKLYKIAQLLSLNTEMEVYKQLVSHWPIPNALVLGATEPITMLTGLQSMPKLDNFIRQMMYLDTVSYLPDDILVKVDRASMAVSLETRLPLLDHRIIEFAASLPIHLLRRHGLSKWPLRQVLHRYVPPSLIERPKMGFGVPIDSWLRGPLREWGETLINRSRLDSEGYLNASMVRTAWEQHQSKRGNWQYLLWDVLCFQAWLEHYKSLGLG